MNKPERWDEILTSHFKSVQLSPTKYVLRHRKEKGKIMSTLFNLAWLKQQQERDPERHWYVTGCDCKDCVDTRRTVTFDYTLFLAKEKKARRSKKRGQK